MKKCISLAIIVVISISSYTAVYASSFSDIKSPILQEAVDYLNEKGIIKGYEDGTFKPEQVINRAEALKIIFESRGIAVDEDSDSGFPDVDAKQWFAKYVTSAKRKGLIKGYADGTYKPTQEVNKVEFIKIAMLAQDYYQVETDYSDIKSQFSDLDTVAWYMPYVAFGHKMKFIDRVKKLHPTHGITRGEAALIIYQVAQHNEQLAAEVAKADDQNIEDSAVLSCETCVNGVDLGQYEWSKSDVVELGDGKIVIGGYDQTEDFEAGLIDVEFLADLEDHYGTHKYLKEFPIEEKLKVDQLHPELYARATGINGGLQIQSPKKYINSGTGSHILKNIEGTPLSDCDCDFENKIISSYGNVGFETDFEPWIVSDDAKPHLYDEIYFYLKKQEE